MLGEIGHNTALYYRHIRLFFAHFLYIYLTDHPSFALFPCLCIAVASRHGEPSTLYACAQMDGFPGQ